MHGVFDARVAIQRAEPTAGYPLHGPAAALRAHRCGRVPDQLTTGAPLEQDPSALSRRPVLGGQRGGFGHDSRSGFRHGLSTSALGPDETRTGPARATWAEELPRH